MINEGPTYGEDFVKELLNIITDECKEEKKYLADIRISEMPKNSIVGIDGRYSGSSSNSMIVSVDSPLMVIIYWPLLLEHQTLVICLIIEFGVFWVKETKSRPLRYSAN
ncbi:hypothetical protein CEXT_405381 [Caerostris extrusa]|uniref:Uncharacterized protein n=1 Tax=Caerostris extrusa TaxID=172846 RepID=A0AAV4S626_CAEEX|nr:hypothetical protein CEXT_405381 [Caerostris extrusa]